MIGRTFDADRVNAFCNDPAVLPVVCGPVEGPLDLSSIIADRRNIFLAGEHGCVWFVPFSLLLPGGNPDFYDAHAVVLSAGRGAWTRRAAEAAFDLIFGEYGAKLVAMRCPAGRPDLAAVVKFLGARFHTETEPIWPVGGRLVPLRVFVLDRENWHRRHADLQRRAA